MISYAVYTCFHVVLVRVMEVLFTGGGGGVNHTDGSPLPETPNHKLEGSIIWFPGQFHQLFTIAVDSASQLVLIAGWWFGNLD